MSKKRDLNAEALAGTTLSPADAARLLGNICEIFRKKLPDIPCQPLLLTHIFELGTGVYEESTHSERMDEAIALFLKTKNELRPSSRMEYHCVLNRLLRLSPAMAERQVRELRSRDCLDMITTAFHTAHTVDKARRLLHCFFNFALRQNWCNANPVDRLQVMRKQEVVVEALELQQVHDLLRQVGQPAERCCAAAVGLMLWAGIRPFEVARLHWSDIDLDERVVTIQPRHSKTGGCRHITIEPVLRRWLLRFRPAEESARVVPENWVRRWRDLRQAAGLVPWRPDTLRHTFASYHLRHFGDIRRLQLEMGHCNVRLLFSRYLNMRNITRAAAATYWGVPARKEKHSSRESGLMHACWD